MTDRETALAKIRCVADSLVAQPGVWSANEAATRLQLIDEVLAALGWVKHEYNPETAAGAAGFCDYLLTVEGEPRLVIEAKRIGQTFASPTRKLRHEKYSVTYVRSAFMESMSEVLDQASRYAHAQGVGFAVVTNGAEWLVFQVIAGPGETLEDLKCYYIGNVLTGQLNFELFWELLSRPAIQERRLEESFAELNCREVEYCARPIDRLERIAWQVDSQGHLLEDFYYAFFDEIVDPGRRMMLEHCFVSTSRLDQYEGALKRALKDAAPAYIDGAEELTPEDRKRLLKDRLGDKKGRVILVTGSVGCGKSTFVTKVLVDARRDRKTISLAIDLIDELGQRTDQIESLLWSRLHQALRSECPEDFKFERLKSIFFSELLQHKEGPKARVFQATPDVWIDAEAQLLESLLADTPTLLRRFVPFHQSRNRGVVVFIDNVDRASEQFQRGVYAFAHQLARETGATVIVPMREMTYWRGKNSRFLDVRSSDTVYHLQAPDPISMLSRRIKYIESHLETDHRYSKWLAATNAGALVASFREAASALKMHLLTASSGSSIVQFLSAIAWHDVRVLFQLIRTVHRALGSDEPWSLGLVLACLMTSNRTAGGFAPNIPSLYEPSFPNYRNFFIRTRVLHYLLATADEGTTRGVSLPHLLTFCRAYGYHDRWVRRSIEAMVRERLLECVEGPSAAEFAQSYVLGTSDSFRASPLAVVLLGEAQHHPEYLALIGLRLPFHSEQAFRGYVKILEELLDVAGDEGLQRVSVDILRGTDAARIVAHFLAAALLHEAPLAAVARHMHSVTATEVRMSNMMDRLAPGASLLPTQTPHVGPKVQSTGPKLHPAQLQLIPILTHPVAQQAQLPVPDCLRGCPQTTAPIRQLILWALVYMRSTGRVLCTGKEITDAINLHLVSDREQKWNASISKALRSPTLRGQNWLDVSGRRGRYRYGLKPCWPDAWVREFSCAPPSVDGNHA